MPFIGVFPVHLIYLWEEEETEEEEEGEAVLWVSVYASECVCMLCTIAGHLQGIHFSRSPTI